MDLIHGLNQLIRSKEYREALNLPSFVTEEYQLLAQGEYNRNYLFTHPLDGRKLILRVNCGSQMHLEHQIEYEYEALQLLKNSGRTPQAIYVDGSRKYLDHGILVMEYLSGHHLDYNNDLKAAAQCLADIHSVKVPEQNILYQYEAPLKAILMECEEMVKTYMDCSRAEDRKKRKIREMLDMGWNRIQMGNLEIPWKCCINTELNSTNFLIGENGENYLVDWEKPIFGDPAQDLGHFLAPTTTFWKTDIILKPDEVRQFISDYCEYVGNRFDLDGIRERTMTYIPITCLRGITWCAMAWVQYQNPDKTVYNQSTSDKLKAYLSDEYLDMIRECYLE